MQTTQENQEICYHCGDRCRVKDTIFSNGKAFCCLGCSHVFEILSSCNLATYYDLVEKNAVPVTSAFDMQMWEGVKNPTVAREVLSFSDGTVANVTFLLPQIHCSACVWLLENLHSIHSAIYKTQVHFDKQEAYITFNEKQLSLYELVVLLAKLGYPPQKKQEQNQEDNKEHKQRLYMRIGIAAFCASNIMLLQLPIYFDIQFIPPVLLRFFAIVRLALSVLLLLGSFQEYIESAWQGFKQKKLSIDVPIVIGVAALFLQSIYEILGHVGEGYLDSMAGLIFLLLIGRLFQEKTYRQFSFSREYESFFPLSALLQKQNGYENVPLKDVAVNDTLYLRFADILTCDSILSSNSAYFDYSFVSGESKAIQYKKGDYLYAGGKLLDSNALVQVRKPFSAGYLINLWRNYKEKESTQTKQFSRLESYMSAIFTPLVLMLASINGVYWLCHDPSKALFAFTSILIIACPCAFALSVPFTTGTIMRILAKNDFFIKKAAVLEKLAQVNHIVWDKTGTLTYLKASYIPLTRELTSQEKSMIKSMALYSNHPVCIALRSLWEDSSALLDHMEEVTGKGVIGYLGKTQIQLGEASWASQFVKVKQKENTLNTRAILVINEEQIGSFILEETWREQIDSTLESLKEKYSMSLLSGDKKREEITKVLAPIFQEEATLFSQTPEDKQKYITKLNKTKQTLMIGDGLNDTFSLQSSYVSIAVSDSQTHFTPTSDIIVQSQNLKKLKYALQLAKDSIKIIKTSFVYALIYNGIGMYLAFQGWVTPLAAALFMPISSISIVLFTTGSSYLCSFFYRKKYKC